MATDWGSSKVLCPFYISENASAIMCEGLNKNSKSKRSFRKKSDKRRVKQKFCESNYQSCAIYKLLMSKKYNPL